ncbi:MAG TPA: SurA N-terminal domain-containing protein [Vicinamibacteria bacterium]|nr:SurA N-terminal domain-containing protein [Vicinamibacteria bacterium]
MRRHRRWLYVFLWLVIAAFIILYIPAFQGAQAGSPGERLATVGGLNITVGEFQRSYLRQRQFYERLYQGRADAEMLRRLGLEEQVFSGLVAERLVALEAQRLGLSVDDAAVAQEIATAPDYQREGRFVGTAEIRRLLELRGLSVEDFEASVRAELVRRKLEGLVAGGVSVSEAEAEREFRRRSEQIKAEYVLVDAARFRPGATADEGEVGARFEARKADYRVPERRVVEYVLVDADALRPHVSVTEREVELEYEKRKDELKQGEQVCASHVLVKVKGDAGEGHPDDEARAIAEGLRAELVKGADFASVAKRASEDKGSAANGGDLGCFGRGAMVPPFEDAAFGLKAGQLSELVKTPYGYHVIRVSAHREETTPPLAEVRDRLREGLVARRVRALSEEKAGAVAARLEKGDALAKAAAAAALKVERSAPFARNELPAPLASQRLVARAFELKTKGEQERQPFALPQGYAFIALSEVQAPRDPELSEVKERVRADVLQEKARSRARELSAELRSRAERGGLEKAAQALGLVRKETPGLVSRGQALGDLGSGAGLDDVAFALKEQVLSHPVAVEAGYAVLRVLEKKPFDPAEFAKQKDALVAALRQERRQKLFEAFLDSARQRVSVERNAEVFRRLVGPQG